jgi:hypothetical protein
LVCRRRNQEVRHPALPSRGAHREMHPLAPELAHRDTVSTATGLAASPQTDVTPEAQRGVEEEFACLEEAPTPRRAERFWAGSEHGALPVLGEELRPDREDALPGQIEVRQRLAVPGRSRLQNSSRRKL